MMLGNSNRINIIFKAATGVNYTLICNYGITVNDMFREYFERIYTVVFFFFEIILYIFKSMFLVYPPGNIATEIVGLFFMVLLQYVKLNNANTANKTELKAYHFYTLLYLIPVAGCYVFYFYFQVYCLTFDVILSCIGFFFTGLELIFSFVEICTIKS